NDRRFLRTIVTGRLGEIEIQSDTLRTEDLAAVHQPATIDSLSSGPWAQNRTRVIRFGSRPTNNQPLTCDLAQKLLGLGVFELVPEANHQSDDIEVHIDGQGCRTTPLSQALLSFDAVE